MSPKFKFLNFRRPSQCMRKTSQWIFADWIWKVADRIWKVADRIWVVADRIWEVAACRRSSPNSATRWESLALYKTFAEGLRFDKISQRRRSGFVQRLRIWQTRCDGHFLIEMALQRERSLLVTAQGVSTVFFTYSGAWRRSFSVISTSSHRSHVDRRPPRMNFGKEKKKDKIYRWFESYFYLLRNERVKW